jgi:hypothetical protein
LFNKLLAQYDDDGLDIIFSGHHIDILTRLAHSKSTLEVQGHSPWGFVTLPSAMDVVIDTFTKNCQKGKYGPEGKQGFSAVIVLDDQVPEGEIVDVCALLSAQLPDLLQPSDFFISFLAGEVPHERAIRLLTTLAKKFPQQVSVRRDDGDMVSLELFPVPDGSGSIKTSRS